MDEDKLSELTEVAADLTKNMALLKSQLTASNIAFICAVNSMPASSRRTFAKNIRKILADDLAIKSCSSEYVIEYLEAITGIEKKQSFFKRIFWL